MTDEESEKKFMSNSSPSSKSNSLITKSLDKENEIDKSTTITVMATNNLNETAAISSPPPPPPSTAPLSNVDININGEESKQPTKSCDDNFYNNDDEDETKQMNDHQNIEIGNGDENSNETGHEIINNDEQQHEDLSKDEVENDPNFAIICSFLEKFGNYLDLKYSIKHLKSMFEDYTKGMCVCNAKNLIMSLYNCFCFNYQFVPI